MKDQTLNLVKTCLRVSIKCQLRILKLDEKLGAEYLVGVN